jgi:hypothetical protein
MHAVTEDPVIVEDKVETRWVGTSQASQATLLSIQLASFDQVSYYEVCFVGEIFSSTA